MVNSADINFAGARITYGTATTTSSSAANIDTFLAATYRSAKYQVSIVDSTNTKFGIYELFVTHDGSNAYINAQGISDTGLDLATALVHRYGQDNVNVLQGVDILKKEEKEIATIEKEGET